MARHGSSPPLRAQEGKPYTPDDRSESRWVPKPGKTHRAIAIDLPGYGLSDKPLDALDIHDTDLVVHDLVGAMQFGVVHKDRLTREVLTPYTAPFESPAARQALIKAGSGLSIKGLAEIARELPTLEAPLRLIYGENDRILPDIAKTMQRIQHDCPGTELTALPGCGHFLQEDEPERVGQLMAEFFNSAPR